MAEFVEQRMEEMMNEVEQMERVNLLQVKRFEGLKAFNQVHDQLFN